MFEQAFIHVIYTYPIGLGVMAALGSYNKFNYNFIRSAQNYELHNQSEENATFGNVDNCGKTFPDLER